VPLITIENLTVGFGDRRVLDGISFTVNEGDKIAFIGNNGCGKTTLFKAVKGIITPDDGSVTMHGNTVAGFLSQNMEEQDLSSDTLKPRALIAAEARLSELESLLSDNPTDDLLNEYSNAQAEFESLGGYDYEHRMKEALSGLGLKNTDGRLDLSTLSGGEKMRVCLARLIVDHPDVLMLDEPTNHLDTGAIEWLENFVASYKGSVFVITHDRYFIDAFANRVIELDGGHIRQYRGNYSSYKVQKEEFLKTQISYVESLEQEFNRQLEIKQTMLSHRNISGYHQHEKLVDKIGDVLEKQRALLPSGEGKMSFKAVPAERLGANDKLLISVKDVSKSFDGAPSIFKGVSFEVHAGDKIFIAGPNGCGKSTLLSMILGKSEGDDGTIFVSGSSTMGFMEQFVPFDDEELSLYDELIRRTDLTVTDARTLLSRFGFRGDDVFKQIKSLSGGERNRLYLCCVLQENPEILILDEPTNHLDIESREILEDALKEYTGAIVCVSHDRFFIDKCADKVLGFIDGTTKLFDSYKYYMNALTSVNQKAQEKTQTVAVKSSKNPAENRKLEAKRRNRITELEKKIDELEEIQRQLGEKFSSGEATREDYDTYACNADVIEKMYYEYESLC